MRRLAIGWVLGWTLACAGSDSAAPPGSGAPGSGLRPATDLVTDCYGFPQRQFNRQNHADVGARLQTGASAVDFQLRDVDGAEVRLADLLKDEPVLLVQGSYTCPRFEAERPGLEDLVHKYDGKVHVVLVYNIEAHPAEAPSPYRGRVWTDTFSDRSQPRSYEERLRNAREVARGSALKVLVDDYAPGHANPVWCTYGTCASCSWLIARDGTIAANHEWHDSPSMETSIDALLAKPR